MRALHLSEPGYPPCVIGIISITAAARHEPGITNGSISHELPLLLPVSTSAQNHLYSSLLELCSLGTSLPPLPGLFLSLPYEQLGGVNGTVMNVEKAEIVAKEDFRPMVCIKPPAPSKGPPRRWCSACVVD